MFRTLLAKEFREQRRTFRLWVVAAILLVSGMISPLLAKYTPLLLRSVPGLPPAMATLIPEPTILDSYAQYVKNISQFGLILVIVVTMGVVAAEKERGTAAMLLTKPVRRSAIILAKWLASESSMIFGLLLAFLMGAFYTWVLFGEVNLPGFLALNLMLAVFLSFYISLAILASSLARGQATAAAAAFGFMILALALDAFPLIGDYFPSGLMSWGVALSARLPGGSAWSGLVASLVMIALFLFLACLRLEREEI